MHDAYYTDLFFMLIQFTPPPVSPRPSVIIWTFSLYLHVWKQIRARFYKGPLEHKLKTVCIFVYRACTLHEVRVNYPEECTARRLVTGCSPVDAELLIFTF